MNKHTYTWNWDKNIAEHKRFCKGCLNKNIPAQHNPYLEKLIRIYGPFYAEVIFRRYLRGDLK